MEERRNGMEAIEERMDLLESTVETNHELILNALVGPEDITGTRRGGMQADIHKSLKRQITRRDIFILSGSIITAAAMIWVG